MYIHKEVFETEMDIEPIFFEASKVMFLLKRNKGEMLGETSRGFTRVPLILQALKAVQLKRQEDPSLQDYVQCVKLYFSATSEPFVSADELKEFLFHLFQHPSQSGYLYHIVQDFKTLFHPISSKPYSPRTLTHLCRCTVRNSLYGKKTVLVKMLEELNIPCTLKSLLLGAEEIRSDV